jgi:hypothetical protein
MLCHVSGRRAGGGMGDVDIAKIALGFSLLAFGSSLDLTAPEMNRGPLLRQSQRPRANG